jgi:iron complex outermembrane receptor protein
MNDWTVALTNRYVSEITERCTGLVSDFGFSNLCTTPTSNDIGAKLYTDLQVSWSPAAGDNRWTIQGGVQNLFNTKTPICYSCDLNSFDGTLHPISGSFLYGRISYRL